MFSIPCGHCYLLLTLFQDHNCPSRHHAGVQARTTVHGRRGHLCNSNQTSVTFWSARWSLELHWSQQSNQDKYSFLFHWLISAPFNRYGYSSPYAQRPAVLPISTSLHDIVIVHIAQPSVNRRSCPCSFPSCPRTSIYHQFQESSAQKQVHLHKWHGVIEDNTMTAQYTNARLQDKHVGRSFPLPFPFFPLPSFPLPFGLSKASFRFLAKIVIDCHCSAIPKSSRIILTATKKSRVRSPIGFFPVSFFFVTLQQGDLYDGTLYLLTNQQARHAQKHTQSDILITIKCTTLIHVRISIFAWKTMNAVLQSHIHAILCTTIYVITSLRHLGTWERCHCTRGTLKHCCRGRKSRNRDGKMMRMIGTSNIPSCSCPACMHMTFHNKIQNSRPLTFHYPRWVIERFIMPFMACCISN